MSNFFKLNKLILQIFFLYIVLLTGSSDSLEKYYRGDSVSNYFSGILSLQDNNYKKSYNFFKKLENLEDNHFEYSRSFLETLVNNSKINEAFKYSKKLQTKKMNFFQSDLVILSKYVKSKDFQKANNLITAINKNNYTPLEELMSLIILNWVQVEKFNLNYYEAYEKFKLISPQYENIKRINKKELRMLSTNFCYGGEEIYEIENLKN